MSLISESSHLLTQLGFNMDTPESWPQERGTKVYPFTREKFIAYCQMLAHRLEEIPGHNAPFHFLISYGAETIALSYQADQSWVLTRKSEHTSHSKGDESTLVDTIFNHFEPDETLPYYSCSITSVLAQDSSYSDALVEKFTVCNQDFPLTEEACRGDAKSLAYEAAVSGCVDVFHRLITFCPKLDLNGTYTEDNYTLACLAAENGHEEFLKVLAKKNVDLNKSAAHGGTPIFYAAQYGHKTVLDDLITLDVSIHEVFQQSKEELLQLAKKGDQKVRMNAFIDEAALNQNGLIELEPYDIAKIMGYEDIAESLRKQDLRNWCFSRLSKPGEDKNSTMQSAMTLYFFTSVDDFDTAYQAALQEKQVRTRITESQLNAVMDKLKDYALKNKEQYVAKEIHRFYLELIYASKRYSYNHDEVEFKKSCDEAMEQARPILEKHRGLGVILEKLCQAINWILRGVGIERYRLFAPKTHSIKLIEQVQQEITNISLPNNRT